MTEWYCLHAALNFFAVWFLFSGCADLARVRLPRWLGPVYIGASIPLDILFRYVAPWALEHWLGWTGQRAGFWGFAGTIAVQYIPVLVTRVFIIIWLFRLWRSTRMPGAFVAAFFCVPYTVFAFVSPLQIYSSYYPRWLFIFQAFRIFGFSLGILMLLMGRQQRALEDSERRLRSIFDYEPEGVCVVAADGSLQDMNPAGLRMIEADALPQFASGDISTLIVKEHQAAFRELTQRVFRGETGILEFQIIGLKGSRRWLEIHATGLRTGHGDVTEMLGITRDLTERKKIEAQFLRAQRTESIGTLAAGIAHDLNNRLAPVLMSVELLKSQAKDDHERKLIEILQEGTQGAAALVKQVLSFARGVEGQSIMVNPATIMRDLVQMMRDTFPKSIIVSFASSRGGRSVIGDPTQLYQVFLNLCVNARDAMPEGGRLAIKIENVLLDETYAAMNPGARPIAYVVVSVEDSGTGIPPEIRDKIFEPFFTTKEIGQGTGLGLATTLAIVKSHGGFINLYSEMRQGTTFKVYIPASGSGAAAELVAAEKAELPRGHGELVLVVDDEKPIREIARQVLEQFGYRVLVATNGAEAVILYVQHQAEIAVVLSDMAMPVMDGPALIAALTAVNPRVKIIGSSGLESDDRLTKVTGANHKYLSPNPTQPKRCSAYCTQS